MALTRIQTEMTYRSDGGGVEYFFTLRMDQAQNVSVRDIRTPTGPIINDMTLVPESVLDDIQTAIGQLEDLVGQTSAINGFLTFTNETSQTFTFTTPLSNTNYRVVFSSDEFMPIRVANKLTTGFTIELGITFTGDVGFDVFI